MNRILSPWRNRVLASGLAAVWLTVCPTVQAATAKPAAKTAAASQPADMPMYGSQLMTDKERTEFRARMWAAPNDEERNRIRAEHHEAMQKRAQAQGVTLPDEPPMMMGGPGRGGMGMMQDGRAASAPCAASEPPCAASGPRAGRHHRRHHRGMPAQQ